MRLAILACMLGCASAGWAGNLTAGEVENRCQGNAEQQRQACIGLLDGFLAGYITGVQKGIRSTFALDDLVLQTTNGNEDTYLRYRQIEQRSLCLPPQLDGAAASTLLLAYLQANPSTREEPLGDVLEVALDAASQCATKP